MKNLRVVAALIFGVLLLAGNVYAQSNIFKLGGGLIYGSEVDELGIKLGGEYRFNENWGVEGDFDIFFTENNVTWWDINANAQYIFFTDSQYHVYALGGLNLSTIDVGFADESSLGVNIGGGFEYHLEKVSLYADIKFNFNEDPHEQLVLGGGVRVPINR